MPYAPDGTQASLLFSSPNAYKTTFRVALHPTGAGAATLSLGGTYKRVKFWLDNGASATFYYSTVATATNANALVDASMTVTEEAADGISNLYVFTGADYHVQYLNVSVG